MEIPEIMSSTTTRSQAITDIIQSVAYEQAALAHIINAEGEKLQKAVFLENNSTAVLLTNNSIKKIISAATLLEIVLLNKLELFKDFLCPEPEPSIPVENVKITIIPPDLGRVVTKKDNQHFTIGKQNATTEAGSCLIELAPDYPLSLVSAPMGVSLSGSILTIDYSVVSSGQIILTTGVDECEMQVFIEFFQSNE